MMQAAAHTTGGSSLSEFQWAVEQIEAIVSQLGSGPGALSALRGFVDSNPKALFRAATKLLEPGLNPAARRILLSLLARQSALFDWLLDGHLCSVHTAVRIFRQLLDFDATLDFRLARMLPGRGESDFRNSHEIKLSGASAARALEILDQTSPGQRLLSLVGHLPNNPDPYVSGKAALFVGRRVNNPSWVEKQLIREEPRVRANALESLWGMKSDAAIRIMEECVDDTNNRVAGNALVGLHMAGCRDAILKTVVMSLEDDPRRRAAAAWVMGKIGDTDFIECLTTLVRDTNPKVRSTAVRSLGQISREETKRLERLAAEERLVAESNELCTAATEQDNEEDQLSIPVPAFQLLRK